MQSINNYFLKSAITHRYEKSENQMIKELTKNDVLLNLNLSSIIESVSRN